MEDVYKLLITLTNEYFSLKNKIETIMPTTTADVLAKLAALTEQAKKVKQEYETKLAEKDAAIETLNTQNADLQAQVSTGTNDVPDEVSAQIDSLGEQLQAMDDQNADAEATPPTAGV